LEKTFGLIRTLVYAIAFIIAFVVDDAYCSGFSLLRTDIVSVIYTLCYVEVLPDFFHSVTTNPGYAGRSNLPDNLKKLFRNVAMTHPDRELIAQVMLFSQGFRTAETLASKIVPFFNLCSEQLSSQPHYDFGLRALKAVLVSAGHLKRHRIRTVREEADDAIDFVASVSNSISEQEIVIQSVMETIVPKLVAEDVPLLTRFVVDVQISSVLSY
jgi:hypothetical protein